MGGMFDFDSFDSYAIKPIYVAGNISAILSRKEMKNIFSQMDENSAVVIVGHAHCGAVHCAKESAKYAKLKNISDLLKHVDAGGEFQNLQKQIISLSNNPDFLKASKKKSIRILGAFANLDSDSVGFRFLDSNSLYRSDKSLERRLDSNFKQSNSEQNLSNKQYAHAIVISSPSLLFDSREIFDCGANEIFCVSASDNSDSKKLAQKSIASTEIALQNLLDEPAIASTEYSVKNNSTKHIVLLHTDMAVINTWKRELLQKSSIIYDAIKNDGVRISSFIYDDMTGKTYAIE
jgi:hypothetical protein